MILSLILVMRSYAFAPKMSFDDKCQKSDMIVQGEVVNVTNLFPNGSRPNEGGDKDNEKYFGPKSVAVFRVQKVIKGDSKYLNRLILIPCQYDSDISPSELTKSKNYVLFLEQMGRGYFHPLAPSCTHRVLNNRVGLSGLDWDGDFDSEIINGENISLPEFIEDITKSVKSKNKK